MLFSLVFSGCSNSSFVNSKISDVLAQNNSSEDAIEWLIYNRNLVAPVLADRLSSGSKAKVNETKELLNIMGKEGASIVLSDFSSLSESGKAALADVLASQMTKDSMLQLLAMSTLNGGFDVSVNALIKMGDTADDFLETLLYQDKYYDCVNAVLAGNSERVISDIIPLVYSQNSYIQNRAFEILAVSSSEVVTPLVETVLSDSTLTKEKAIKISTVALYNNREIAIDAIIKIVALGNADPETSATMLYELTNGENLGIVFEKCATSSNAVNTNDMLKELVNQAGVSGIIQTALNSQSNEIITSISFALSSYDIATDSFVEILNSVQENDNINSSIYELAGKLIYDPILSKTAQAIIASDAAALTEALNQEGANPKIIGDALSLTSGNLTIASRLDSMIDTMDSTSAKSVMIVLAYGTDALYPKLVWDRYISSDQSVSKNAMDVILEATSVGIKFKYTDMNFLPYAQKLAQDLTSSNSEIKNTAIQILNKIPEGVEHHDFYEQVYEKYKDLSVFTILCWHYVGEGAKKLNLQVEGTSNVISEISYEIKSIKVTGIDQDDFIDYEGMVALSLTTLGLKIVDNANTKLVISINETPLSKRYYGLVGDSYLGAKCTTKIEIYIGGQLVSTVSGYYEIQPPSDNPVGTSVFEYKTDPTDAPLETPFITSYIEAIYKTFGENVLFGTYQYDRQATLEAGKALWQ